MEIDLVKQKEIQMPRDFGMDLLRVIQMQMGILKLKEIAKEKRLDLQMGWQMD